MSTDTCPWSIRWGTTETATTHCSKPPHVGSGNAHCGPGLMLGQTITWYEGDRREYTGEWPGYCDRLPGATFNSGCTLPARHPGRCAP